MKDWVEKIAPAQSGDVEAFNAIVREFQDMAVGYAYSVLRDMDLAEDAAQDAFIEAFRDLSKLREPKAFPGWFRRIVFGRCGRIRRGDFMRTVGLEHADDVPASNPTPAEAAQRDEVCDRVMAAIGDLSESDRTAVTLFYINGYSQTEVGAFLDQPVSTVKSRLHSARGRLRERLKDMDNKEMAKVSETLKSRKPGAEFVRQLKEKLNGRIEELPDGRIQVFYDFGSNKELSDWRTLKPYKALPEIAEQGLAFGRIEPEATDQQWDRDFRLNLVFDSDPTADLEINFDVSMGTNEPWSCAAWILTRREGYGPGIPFFEGVITDWNT